MDTESQVIVYRHQLGGVALAHAVPDPDSNLWTVGPDGAVTPDTSNRGGYYHDLKRFIEGRKLPESKAWPQAAGDRVHASLVVAADGSIQLPVSPAGFEAWLGLSLNPPASQALRTLSVTELSAATGVPRPKINEWVTRRDFPLALPGYKPRRWSAEELENWALHSPDAPIRSPHIQEARRIGKFIR